MTFSEKEVTLCAETLLATFYLDPPEAWAEEPNTLVKLCIPEKTTFYLERFSKIFRIPQAELESSVFQDLIMTGLRVHLKEMERELPQDPEEGMGPYLKRYLAFKARLIGLDLNLEKAKEEGA